jgi:8-oxo-dGTP diphosphatase
MNTNRTVPVVCALIEDAAGRVLVAQRPAHKHLGGLWEFPGGKIEPGEKAEAALQREIAEELGCEIEVGAALAAVRYEYAELTIELRPFVARLVAGGAPPESHEHQALRWVTAEEMATLPMPAADAPILAEWAAMRRGALRPAAGGGKAGAGCV